MKANTEKSHLLLPGSNKLTANTDGNGIELEDSQILLGITIEKLNALARISGYMDLPKRRVIMK